MMVLLLTTTQKRVAGERARAASLQLTFVNPFEETYELYWVPPRGSPEGLAKMAELAPAQETTLTTYVGHEFGWRVLEDDVCSAASELADTVTVKAHFKRYSLGSQVETDPNQDRRPFEAVFTNRSEKRVTLRRGDADVATLGPNEKTTVEVRLAEALDWVSADEEEELLYRTIVEFYGQTRHDFWDTGHTTLCAEDTHATEPLRRASWNGRRVDVLRNETDSFVAVVHDWSTTRDCQEFEATATRHGLAEAQVFGTRTVIADRRALAANLMWDQTNDTALTNAYIRQAFDLTKHFRGYDITPGPFQEPLNFIQYGRAQEYRPHCDGVCHRTPYARGGRVATLLHYCKAADQGGATVFPAIGVKVQPRSNAALLFAYKGLDGYMDNGHTLHAGCLVKRGTKQVITMWMREDLSHAEPWSDFLS